VAFDFMAQWTRRTAYASAAYLNSTFAGLSTIPVVITGVAAYPAVKGGFTGWSVSQRIIGPELLTTWISTIGRMVRDISLSQFRISMIIRGLDDNKSLTFGAA
jgi:hypothetical protein